MKRSECRILIVDDEKDLAEVLVDFLEMEGFTNVSISHSGNQAKELLATSDVDFVLSDVRMPDGDGIELLNFLRAGGRKIPTVFMYSGQIDKEGKFKEEEILKMGADAILAKPLDVDQLIERLCQTLKIED